MNTLASPVKISVKHGEENGSLSTIIYNVEYQDKLLGQGLDNFSMFAGLRNGTVIKKQQDRAVFRFNMIGSVFYLKKHEREKQLHGKISNNPQLSWSSEGGREFAFLCAFRNNDLATAIPVAMGEKVYGDKTVESFLLTENFSPYVQLEYIIRNRPELLSGLENSQKRKNILLAVADYARRMHLAGFNHQDFNATHVLLDDIDRDKPDIALFDLQRVDQNRLHKIRWPIKSLAEFNYSIRENNVFSNQERLFLFCAYKGQSANHLSLYNRFLWKWITAKTNRIARHTAKRHARNHG